MNLLEPTHSFVILPKSRNIMKRMREIRIYQDQVLAVGNRLELDCDAAGHVARVLRMQAGAYLVLFNGDGSDYQAQITSLDKKNVHVEVLEQRVKDNESPLQLHLGQVISRGEKMEFTIQKAVELGVSEITPLSSERCGVKLNEQRMLKKVQQWQKIAISACEQSGRSLVPKVNALMPLEQWASLPSAAMKLNLHPRAPYTIKTLPQPEQGVNLLIGPEGGLSDEEITMCNRYGFIETQLGPRVLRTETAALTAITALQCYFGDLS